MYNRTWQLADKVAIVNRTGSKARIEEITIDQLFNTHPLQSSRNIVTIKEDFLQSSSGTLPAPWAKQDTSSSGTPVIDFVDDAANGEYALTHDDTDEAQKVTLYWGDSLHIPVDKNPIIDLRVKIAPDTAPWSADQRVVFGLASARNATLDSVATHAWFRMEGNNLNIYYEGDDGTTDTNDQDSGVDYADDTYVDLRIDMENLAAVAFYVDDTLVGTVDMSAATGNLQPYIELQKDGGTEEDSVVIDYVEVSWDRE